MPDHAETHRHFSINANILGRNRSLQKIKYIFFTFHLLSLVILALEISTIFRKIMHLSQSDDTKLSKNLNSYISFHKIISRVLMISSKVTLEKHQTYLDR